MTPSLMPTAIEEMLRLKARWHASRGGSCRM